MQSVKHLARLGLLSLLALGLFSPAVFAGKAKKKLYKIRTHKLSLKKGTSGKATFDIVLNKGAKVHPQAPFKCKVAASAGLSASKKVLKHKDTSNCPSKKCKLKKGQKKFVKVPVGVTAKAAGSQSVKMDCSFFICTKDICARKTEKINIKGNVK